MQQSTAQFSERGDIYLLNLAGSRLAGRYEIGERIACGSYAEIFAVRDLATGEAVITKALNPALQGECEAELERTLVENLELEAAALARLRHPNIIELKATGEARDLDGRGFHYLVLEYLPGGTLATLRRQGRLPFAQAMNLMEQVCAGLAHAHSNGVLHRDVKPDNILLTADKRTAKLADFGIARVDHWQGLVTLVGSRFYAAPEHFAHAAETKRLTPAADVYALAKTAYFLFSGEAPQRFAQRQITAWPAAVARAAWVDDVLRVIERATATQPAVRQQTVAEFWAELKEASQAPGATRVKARETKQHERSRIIVGWTNQDERASSERQRRDQAEILSFCARAEGFADSCLAPSHAGKTGWTLELPKPVALRDGRVAVVWLLILILCGGGLLATCGIVREVQQRSVSREQRSPVGRVGVMTTDVNIRLNDSTSHPPIGLAERASRVRVLAERGDWYLIEVVRHVRPKESPQSTDQGWIRGKYVIFDEDRMEK